METTAAQPLFRRIWNAFITAFRYYAAYSGRSSRFDFWSFTIINGLINISMSVMSNFWEPVSLIYFLYSVFSFSPSVAVGIRRYHDSGINAWIFLFINAALIASLLTALNNNLLFFFLISAILIIINLYIMLRKGDAEANQFGLPETTPSGAFETAGTIVFTVYLLLNIILFAIGFINGYNRAMEHYRNTAPASSSAER